ncbi:MAG: hypothetical protein MUE97_08135 [Phycisphaerales bacterium]|jgi:hypothetical protein|nr:hypothetical protein [Phycisphaerales bacterium]
MTHEPTNPAAALTTPGQAADPTLPRVSQHRPCRGCGYDVFSLATNGACPECSRSVAETLATPLLRDTPAECWRIRLGLRLMFIGTIATVGLALVMILAVVGFANLLGGISERNLFRGMIGFVSIGVLTGGAGWGLMCVSMLRMTRVAAIGLALAGVSVVLGVMLIPVTDNAGSTIGPGMICLVWTVVNFGLLLMWVRLLSAIADRVGRFGARPQVTRYRWLTTLWHTLALLPSLGLSVALAIDAMDSSGMSSFWGVMIPAWFLAWIGHAAWAVYSLVVVWRLSGAVGEEVRAASTIPS